MTTHRIDKWLWAVRLFKTRNIASEACRIGKVKINDQKVKPSREVKIDEIITIQIGLFTKTVRVKDLLKNRVSAKLATNYVDDLTSEEEIQKYRNIRNKGFELRDKGIGRPTKRQRRELGIFKKYS